MEIWIIFGLAIVGIFVVPRISGDEKTKLFRRVWSSQLGRSTDYKSDKEFEAIKRLLSLYGIENDTEGDELRGKIASLMADAATFDINHPRNFGVEVAQVLAIRIRMRFPNLEI